MEANNKHLPTFQKLKTVCLSLAAGLALTACGHGDLRDDTSGEIVQVNISFDDKGCPTGTGNPEVAISKAGRDRIEWIAVDSRGDEISNVVYQLYYNPFVGNSAERRSDKGRLTSKPVDSSAPTNVTFKYTIVSDSCTGSPLDPRIRVL